MGPNRLENEVINSLMTILKPSVPFSYVQLICLILSLRMGQISFTYGTFRTAFISLYLKIKPKYPTIIIIFKLTAYM